jgi:lipopolysaccharide transport system ATP-binding protein
MKNFSITAENIGKHYQIKTGQRYGTLKETINRIINPFHYRKKLRSNSIDRKTDNKIWALKDISFTISHGEVVGLIGRNGAGKSTLLKIIAGITTPSCGKAKVVGKIGCLLEVGAGFHPFLTGRENIFLSGSVLGLSRVDIKSRLDEIIAFAEIEAFIDTQIKYYSSGMYTRLAFAVAAHMVVDILIVDEILSVGDIAFQKKCLGKMDEAASDGRTVLFVSHNMATIKRLCNRGILFHQGKMIMDATIENIVSQYLNNYCNTPSQRKWTSFEFPGNNHVKLLSIRAKNLQDKTIQTIDIQETVGIEIIYQINALQQWPVVIVHFMNAEWLHLFSSHDYYKHSSFIQTSNEICETCWIPGQLFNQGRIFIHLEISSLSPQKKHVNVKDAISFEVIDQRCLEEMKGPFGGQWPGVLRPDLKWDIKQNKTIFCFSQ